MVLVELKTGTLGALVSGLYCSSNGVNAMAIPQSVWIEIAEKLEYFLPMWNFEKISFEDWVNTCLVIYPKEMISEEELDDLKKDSLYWERMNGNVLLFISMNIRMINSEADK